MILQVDQKIHFLCAFYSVVHNKMGKWWAEERITRVAIFMIYCMSSNLVGKKINQTKQLWYHIYGHY